MLNIHLKQRYFGGQNILTDHIIRNINEVNCAHLDLHCFVVAIIIFSDARYHYPFF